VPRLVNEKVTVTGAYLERRCSKDGAYVPGRDTGIRADLAGAGTQAAQTNAGVIIGLAGSGAAGEMTKQRQNS
jgi:hypothetical protein